MDPEIFDTPSPEAQAIAGELHGHLYGGNLARAWVAVFYEMWQRASPAERLQHAMGWPAAAGVLTIHDTEGETGLNRILAGAQG